MLARWLSGSEDGLPLTGLLAEGLSFSLAFGRRAKFLTTWTSSEDCLSVHMIRQLTSCRISDPGEEAKEHFNSFYDLLFGSHTIILALVSATHPQCQTLFFFLSAATFCQGPYLNFRLWLCPESQVPTGKRILQILRDGSLLPLGLSSLACSDFSPTSTMCLCYSVVV